MPETLITPRTAYTGLGIFVSAFSGFRALGPPSRHHAGSWDLRFDILFILRFDILFSVVFGLGVQRASYVDSLFLTLRGKQLSVPS